MEKLKATIAKIETVNKSFIEKTQTRLDYLTKPQGSLGRLEEIAKQIAAITEKESPKTENKVIFTMAADHGVTKEGVSAFPQEVTQQMVYNFLRGKAAINVLARHVGARVIVIDMGVAAKLALEELGTDNFIDKKLAFGTKNMAEGKAMTRAQAIASIESGIEIFEKELARGIDIAGTGDMGIGNTTSSSAIVAAITKSRVEDVTGRGTGIDDIVLAHKIEVIKKSLEINAPEPKDPIDVLSKVGGFEIAGLTGIILASACYKVPVIIDGFISTAAALIAYQLEPKVKDFILASHCSAEKGHKITLDFIGLKPLLNFDMRLGEGSAAALAMSIAEAAIKILTEMATFQSAAVSQRIISHDTARVRS